MNVVVVEDDDELRELIVDALCNEGHQVIGIDCAEDLPEKTAWMQIDVIVVDLNLPGEDGLALTRRIHSSKPGTGIIMVTGCASSDDRKEAFSSGADIYLTKPVSIAELNAAMQALAQRLKPASPQEGVLILNLATLSIKGHSRNSLHLSPQESALMVAFCRAADARLETWQIIEILGKNSTLYTKTAVEITMSRLREKIRRAGMPDPSIKAIRNWGYQLCVPVQLT